MVSRMAGRLVFFAGGADGQLPAFLVDVRVTAFDNHAVGLVELFFTGGGGEAVAQPSRDYTSSIVL